MTSVDELALRVLLPAFTGTTLPADWAELFAEGLGGVCLFGSNTADGPAAIAELTAQAHFLLGARHFLEQLVNELGRDEEVVDSYLRLVRHGLGASTTDDSRGDPT